MKVFKFILTALLIVLVFAGCKNDDKSSSSGKSKFDENDLKSRASYAFGHDAGRSIRSNSTDEEIDINIFTQALKDGYNGKESMFTQEEIVKITNDFQNSLMEKRKKDAEKNLAEGKAFLEKNKTKKGVVTLPSGLQYKIIKEGKGAKPSIKDTVKTRYTGKFIDGKKFDGSPENGDPVEFPVGNVIKAWQEALTLMPVGSKWELYVPADLGYGEYGSSGSIPPNSVLIFEVELLDFKKAENMGGEYGDSEFNDLDYEEFQDTPIDD